MSTTPPAPTPIPAAPPTRVPAIDAYRGFVMFLMLAEVLRLPAVAKQFPDSPFWQAILFHTTHVEWVGCSLHDLIQPSFSFLVGVAMVFSLAARKARGEPFWKSAVHAGWRSVALVALGVILRSVGDGHKRTYFTFEDTLSQIGLGYFLLFLIGQLKPRWWWVALGVIVVGYWAAFVAYPLPASDFDFEKVGVSAKWAEDHHNSFTGLAAHWKKNSNLAWAADTWFLNLFPRASEFKFNGGGYATASFIPTLATMILGLIAGGWLRRPESAWRQVLWLTAAGAVGLAAGRMMGEFGVCPVVKRIWTPSWVLFSGGWCFLILALFHALTAGIGYAGWTYPLRVIGANSILIYVIAEVPLGGWLLTQLQKHLPADTFPAVGRWVAGWADRAEDAKVVEAVSNVAKGAVLLVVYWLLLWWLYLKRVFVRI
jgi:heparan-alpha-glucosaminide N-acetyltransferase